MAKEIIGIDISDYSIEAVLLHKKGKSFEVSSYSRFRLSPDIVEDGNILNKDKLQEAIQQTLFHAQPKQIQANKVFLSIPESKVFTKVISLPDDLTEKDVREAAQNKASEIIPEAVDNLVAAMKILPVNNGFRDVFYSAAQLGAIKDITDVFKNLKMEILGITTEAVSSFVGLDDELKDKVTLMMDIGNRTTIASIFDENGIRDTININIAGENIVKSLVAKTGVAYNIAEEKMRDVGMIYSVEHGETMMIVQGQLQPLLDEIKIFINYFEQSTDKKIEQLVLIGGLAQMKGIDKYFGENLSLEVVRGISFLGDKILPNQVSSTKYINALGLARFAFDKIEINFYNDEFKKKIVEKKEIKEENGVPEKKQKEEVTKKDNEGGVKILEEEYDDDFDDEEKPFYKNKVTATILIILCLAAVFVIFKDKILSLVQKDQPAILEEQEKVGEKPIDQAPIGLNKVFSQNILVGLENVDNSPLFVVAELFEVETIEIYESDKYSYEQLKLILELGPGALAGTENINATQEIDGAPTNVLFSEEDDVAVSDILNSILKKSETDIVSSLNISTLKESYYILESIVSSNVVDVVENEESETSKFSTKFIIKYNFYSVAENKLLDFLQTGIDSEESAKLADYRLDDKKYVISGRKEGDILDLNIKYTYIKK